MARKTKTLEDWCMEAGNNILLLEWDVEKNKTKRFYPRPSDIAYNSPLDAFWKCKFGHEWVGPIAARTIFNRTCPICDPKQTELTIGSKYGCLTIIDGFEDSCVDSPDRITYDHNSRKRYICRCKCGKIQYMDEFHFLEKKHRYCSGFDYSIVISGESEFPILSVCGLKKKQEEQLLQSYSKEYDASYHIDYLNTVHESLEVIECVNDHYEVLCWHGDKRRKDSGMYRIYKVYKCRCYLCGKEQEIVSSKFSIHPPSAYGSRAYGGYYSEAFCDCHKISSFQWIVTKILAEHKVPYRVEYSFSDLYGARYVNLLRYDFAILDSDGSIKCLIECQGEQHYEPVGRFGGAARLEEQKKNDERKRMYAAEHCIPLYEIPYTNKKYEKVQDYLKSKGII